MGLDEVDRMQWEMVTPTLKVMIQPQRPPKVALRLALQALNLYAILLGGSSSDMRCESLTMRRKLAFQLKNLLLVGIIHPVISFHLEDACTLCHCWYLTTPSSSRNLEISIRLQVFRNSQDRSHIPSHITEVLVDFRTFRRYSCARCSELIALYRYNSRPWRTYILLILIGSYVFDRNITSEDNNVSST